LLFSLASPLPALGDYEDDCRVGITVTPDSEKGNFGKDRLIDKTVCFGPGTYNYNYVNIVAGGKLIFLDAKTDFWARSILVEKGGSLIAGSPDHPFGMKDLKNILTIHLFGDEKDRGIACKTDPTSCGVPETAWLHGDDGKVGLPGGVSDYFYAYKPLPTDDDLDPNRYFGRKVLAVSYDGTLLLFGRKGATYRALDPDDTGTSWGRLSASVYNQELKLDLDRIVRDWEGGDRVVVTTTDYLPGHSEELTIDSVQQDDRESDVFLKGNVKFPHFGQKYSLVPHDIPARLDKDGFRIQKVETRAAIALLTRSIRIVSEACADYSAATCQGMPEKEGVYFGGHTIFRQGFRQVQVQGVEFRQLGQGGRMAHSPVNFHLTRRAPADTFVRDCSINESMTRWIELRGAGNVTLERNVGYKSIGHGFFLAEGAEVDNTLRANLGIYARPAVDYRDNPRKVPGIISRTSGKQFLQDGGDYVHPSVFYIMNGYNTIEHNMAAGAGTCGACYWIVPAKVSGLSKKMKWEGYAAVQVNKSGTAPLRSFKGNFCSTAQHSLITVDTTGICRGVYTDQVPDHPALHPVANPFTDSYAKQDLLPVIPIGAYLQPTRCAPTPKHPDDACASVNSPDDPLYCIKGQTDNCVISAIDSYTSSFHWAQQNFAAIWLRSNWFVLTDSALTDVLNGGLTMVSGGSYDQVVNGYWALTRRSAFIGSTQAEKDNPYATSAGPVSPKSGLQCETGGEAYCLMKDEGVSYPTDNFAMYQRLYNIYDGPVYQETNAFLNIRQRVLNCSNPSIGICDNSGYMYGPANRSLGIPRAKEGANRGKCILPNAAIGWKQPNAFYYPPAFHSRNLYFNGVDVRHFIIVPLFKPGTAAVDTDKVKNEYCTYHRNTVADLFSTDFTDIDRQTELNDDDGTLSGLAGAKDSGGRPVLDWTISVNRDRYFETPQETVECLSEQSCFQVPYDYVSAVVYPDCATRGNVNCDPDNKWASLCENRFCYGIPLYRQYLIDRTEPVAGDSIVLTPGDAFAEPMEILPIQGYRLQDPANGGKSTLTVDTGRISCADTACKAYKAVKRINSSACIASAEIQDSESKEKGATTFKLKGVVNWQPGDPVIITDPYDSKREMHVLTGVTKSGSGSGAFSTITITTGITCDTCRYMYSLVKRIDQSGSCTSPAGLAGGIIKGGDSTTLALDRVVDWNRGEYPSPEQSIRMMGADLSQRSSLITNRGAYYLETTVSGDTQRSETHAIAGVGQPPNVTVFEEGKRYNVFLLYTKPSTRLTFQLYVGKGRDKAATENDARMIRVGLNRTVEGEGIGQQPEPRADNTAVLIKPLNVVAQEQWPGSWTRSYDAPSGILTVTMDMGEFQKAFDDGLAESCRPGTFCEWNKIRKTCDAKDQSIIGFRGDDSLCQWSVKAMECPSGGCFGFQFGLPADFKRDDGNHRPAPVRFAECEKIDPLCKFDKTWNVGWAGPQGPTDSVDKTLPEQFEETTVGAVELDDANRSVITLSSAIQCDGCAYQAVRRFEAGTKRVTGWAWLGRGVTVQKGDTRLPLDRAVDWKPGERIAVTAASRCDYGGTLPPPLPVDLWR
jgi:hypothetical protein